MPKLAPALLLAALCGRSEAFAPASRPAAARPLAQLSMANDFDKDYDVEVDRRGNIQHINPSGLDRRGALAKAAAAATAASIGLSLLGGGAAWAADKQPTEFSEAPTSDAAIARMAYDGKAPPPKPAAPPAPAAGSSPAAAQAEAKSGAKTPADFDGNEAGAVGPSDEGVQRPGKTWRAAQTWNAANRDRLDPKNLPPISFSNGDITTLDPRLLGGVAVVGAAAIAVGANEAATEERQERIKDWSPPTQEPYGFGGGRNYWDGVDVAAAKKAGLVEEKKAPAKAAPAPPPAPAPPVTAEEKKETEAWKLNLPTPYGIANAGGNPFLKNVEDYCVGGKVTEDCAETIKDYLDTVSNTGAAATSGEVAAIAGYLDSLGSNASSGTKGKAGAAFASYLDALSEGSAPPPSSAKAVKTYLDTLKGTAPKSAPKSAAKEPAVPKKAANAVLTGGPKTSPPKVGGDISMAKIVEEAKAKAAGAAGGAAGGAGGDMSAFDGRLTSIEGRVTSLETKVDALPDKVFEKIEAWQTGQEERLSGEVRKIVEALSPSPAPAAPAPVVAAPAPVVAEPVPAPVPVPAGPVVQASPLGGPIPERGFPQAGSGASVKKGFGFGSNASWKTSSSPSNEIATVSAPSPAPKEPAVPKKAANAVLKGGPKTSPPKVGGDISMAKIVKEAQAKAVVQASPLAGAIPERGFPTAGSGAPGPKKGYGFGGGASWKTGAPAPTPEPAMAAPALEPQQPIEQASTLGAIPERGFPQAGSGASGPKGGYGFGGGASWKTGEAKKGSGYLDNMAP